MVVWRRSTNDPGGVELEFLDCTFNGNSTDYEPMPGEITYGAVVLSMGGTDSYCTVKRCTFNDNTALGSGGGLQIIANGPSEDSYLLMDSCSFSMNESQRSGSALYTQLFGDNFELEITNSLFEQNNATGSSSSGAISLWGTAGGTGIASVDNCHFEGNTAGEAGAIWMGNVSNNGAFMDFVISNSTFIGNEVPGNGGAIAVSSSSESQTDVTIEGCSFTGNSSDGKGGAIRMRSDPGINTSNYHINRCSFTDNMSTSGGALYIKHQQNSLSEVLIENSLISDNSSDAGTVFVDTLSKVVMRNCTVAENNANGLEIDLDGDLSLQNTILYNSGYLDFYSVASSNAVQSLGGNMVSDNSMDGLLNGSGDLDNSLPDFDADFKPLDGGNLVNAGINDAVSSAYDLAMNPRIQQGYVDIGAYESPFTSSSKEVFVEEISVFPNPAKDFFYFELPFTYLLPVEISVFGCTKQARGE